GMFEIGLFGTTNVRAGVRVLRFEDLPAAKPRQLLEILAVARGTIVGKPALAERLWAGRPTPRWQAALDTHLTVLRRALEPGVAARARRGRPRPALRGGLEDDHRGARPERAAGRGGAGVPGLPARAVPPVRGEPGAGDPAGAAGRARRPGGPPRRRCRTGPAG